MVVPYGNFKKNSWGAWMFAWQFKSFLLMGHEKLLKANYVLRGTRA